jgi:hypothetical protein
VKIYNFDKDKKEFLSKSIAIKNPREKGKCLIPANATTKEPLATKEGYAVCFKEGKWVYVVDNRDKTYYLNKVQVNFNLGDEITDDMTLEQYTEEELAIRKRENQTKDIGNAIRNHLDTKAQKLRYDNINAIGKYVGYINDFQAESEALGAWASACWKVAGFIEADVQSGVRVMPTVHEVLAELPVYA